MTSDNKRGFEADIPQSSAFHDAERNGMEGPPPVRTPWMSFMARHLFDDVDPAVLAFNEEGPEDGPEQPALPIRPSSPAI